VDSGQHADLVARCERGYAYASTIAHTCADTRSDSCANSRTNPDADSNANTLSHSDTFGLFRCVVGIAGLCTDRYARHGQWTQLQKQVVDPRRQPDAVRTIRRMGRHRRMFGKSDADTGANASSNANTNAGSDSNANTNTGSDSNADTDTDTNAGSNTSTNTGPDSYAGTRADTGPDSYAGTYAYTHANTNARPRSRRRA
jgi:hypothetical protein